MSKDAYLTDYYFNDSGDQFFPGCIDSLPKKEPKKPVTPRSFFPFPKTRTKYDKKDTVEQK
jgi:hypothetical protein